MKHFTKILVLSAAIVVPHLAQLSAADAGKEYEIADRIFSNWQKFIECAGKGNKAEMEVLLKLSEKEGKPDGEVINSAFSKVVLEGSKDTMDWMLSLPVGQGRPDQVGVDKAFVDAFAVLAVGVAGFENILDNIKHLLSSNGMMKPSKHIIKLAYDRCRDKPELTSILSTFLNEDQQTDMEGRRKTIK